jgi:hypothetical protein
MQEEETDSFTFYTQIQIIFKYELITQYSAQS